MVFKQYSYLKTIKAFYKIFHMIILGYRVEPKKSSAKTMLYNKKHILQAMQVSWEEFPRLLFKCFGHVRLDKLGSFVPWSSV